MAENRRILIHDAARHTDELGFRALAQFRQFHLGKARSPSKATAVAISRAAEELQARARRHFARDEHVTRRDGEASLAQLLSDTQNVITPLLGWLGGGDIGNRDGEFLVEIARINSQVLCDAGAMAT